MTTPAPAPHKDKTISFRMEGDTLTDLKAIVADDDSTVSDVLRRLVKKEARLRRMVRAARELDCRPVDYRAYGPQPLTVASGATRIALVPATAPSDQDLADLLIQADERRFRRNLAVLANQRRLRWPWRYR